MKLETLMMILPLLVGGIAFQFTPLLTRQGLFFSATVDPSFPQSQDGRRVLRSYRLQTGLWTLLACGLAAVLLPQHAVYSLMLPMLMLIFGAIFTYWVKFRQIHTHYGVRRPEVRAAVLTSAAEQTKVFSAWLVPPFLAILAVAFYLQAHWSQLPMQFPVHWGADGQPNRWASRDFLGVYGSLLMAAGMNLFFLGFAWTLSRLARNSVMRDVTIRMLQVMTYPLTFTLCLVALLPLYTIPVWLSPVVMFTFVAVVIYWAYRRITAPAAPGEIPDPQNDSYWKAGVIYYNPDDPAIFVSKRVGIGYTMNFANKVSWFVLAGILLIALLPALLVKAK